MRTMTKKLVMMSKGEIDFTFPLNTNIANI